MAPSRVAGGSAHSSPGGSGIFDGEDGIPRNSQLNSTYGNTLNSVHGAIINPNPGGVENAVGPSSMVTDGNSPYSGRPNLHRSASFNTDIYRIPASPLSFSSNNVSLSGSSIMDGQNSNRYPSNHLQKKPRLDVKQEEIIMQQILNRQQDPLLQSRNQNPHLQMLIQQQRLRQQQSQQLQQQQFLQSMPQAQRAHILQQQQMRQQIQQQAMQPVSMMKRPHDNGICSHRLMKYLYHLRQHPPENTIAYWRKFVTEYYSPHAKKRWCLSSYNNVGNHSLGVFPQSNMDAWRCDICGSKSGKGFEATFDVLPRLNAIKFSSGVLDELLFLDLPRESTFPSGNMMLEYEKAVEESIYEQLRVVREGHLRIIFSPNLKILSWEFCARRHEELLPRRLVAPQVNQLLLVAQKCQNTISESGAEGISQHDLQTNSNMVVTAGRQLAKTLELQSLNDLGFSKTYVRCLQISEVVGSMKNLMDLCGEQKIGPIEGLKVYPQHASSAKNQMQKRLDVAQLANSRSLPTDADTLNKFVNGQMSNSQNMVGRGGLSGSAQAALALTNYQNTLMRQNSISSNNHNSSSTFQIPTCMTTTNMQSSAGFSKSQLQGVSNASEEQSQKPTPSEQDAYRSVAKVSVAIPAPNRSDLNSESVPSIPVNADTHKAPDLPQNDGLSDDMAKDIADAFVDNGFFSDFNDNIDFDWKM